MRLALLSLLAASLSGQPTDRALEEQAYSAGIQAYIYGLAPNIMAVTRDQAAPPQRRNRISHAAALATHQSRSVVAPNNDTLYSTAWLDLAQGPQLLHLPVIRRYHTVQFLDAYTNNFAYAGTRTTGSDGGDFVIHGPGWRGKIPTGARVIAAPTNTVWIIARFLVDGPADIPNVAAIQKQITLKPLERPAPTDPAGPPIGRGKPVVPVINGMNPQEFYGTLARAWIANPPPSRDEAIIKQLEPIGLKPGKPFDYEALPPATQRGLTRALVSAREIVASGAMQRTGASLGNNWRAADITPWGVDYLRRARIALLGLGALDPEEAIYPGTSIDAAGQPLTGSKNYVLRFEPKQLPPVNAFWSLTIYDEQRFLVENDINRYAIGDRTKGLRYEPDGALLIYIQHNRPTGRESNWLPAPSGPFSLNLRLYLPKPEALNGAWQLPKITPTTTTAAWTRFRGPNGSGIAADTGYPVTFSKTQNLEWRTPVRPGKASPVLTARHIFLTAADKRKLYTMCYDRTTGKLLWERAIDQPRTEIANKLNHEAAASPVTDGENVYVFFKDYGFVSYDPAGNLRWRAPFDPFANTMGLGASPILAGDSVVLLADQWEGSFIAALDLRTGEMRWKTAREESESWGTPLLFEKPGDPLRIITVARGYFGLHNAADGRRTASLNGLATTIVGSPILDGDTVYVFGYGGDSASPFSTRLTRFDKNKDGRITLDEYTNDPIMASIGKNGGNRDGVVTEDEWDAWQRKVLGPNRLTALRIENGQVRELWRQDKNFSNVIPTALSYNKTLFIARNGGIFTAHDTTTGDIIKQARIDGAPGGYSSSPVAAEGRIYIGSEEGKIAVLKAQGQWEVIAVNDLGESIFATPALSNGVIYLRTEEALYAFRQQAR
ncbi:MAG: DUF1254 domain-containing protein [Acidobacteria bacterium]|nr:DUF1254 domain-containing protein [Acidobacteriota bacterium]